MMLNWLLFLVLLALAAAPLVATVLMYKTQTRLLRIFSEKQGIPATIMESSKPEMKEPAVKRDTRPRVSVPLPGSQLFKKKV